jgi:small-conductance mechanosensitive channel
VISRICHPRLHAVLVAIVLVSAMAVPGATAGQAQPPSQPTPAAAPSPAQAPAEQAESRAAGVPVMVRGREVFRIYGAVGGFMAAERAESAARRLERIASDQSIRPRDLTVEHRETSSDFILRGEIVGTVTDDDATMTGRPRREVADQLLVTIRRVIEDTRAEFSARALAIGAATSAAATLVFLLLAGTVVRLGRRVLDRLADRRERRTGSLRIQRVELLSVERGHALLAGGVRLVRAAAFVALTGAWIEVVLNALPWTRPYARLTLVWLEAPLAFLWNGALAILPNLFYLAIITLAATGLLSLIRLVFDGIKRGAIRFAGFDPEWADSTYSLVRVLVVALAVVAAYPYIPGSGSPAFQGIGLLLGVLVSFSSTGTVTNAVAGTILTYTGAFNAGDRVKIGDALGDVVLKSLLATHVRTDKNEVVSIPNGVVLAGAIVNYTKLAAAHGIILHTSVTIGYDAPWRQVHDLLLTAARRTDLVLAEPKPFVLQTSLDDSYVSYQINVYTDRPERMLDIYSWLHASIQDAFNEAGVEILSPSYAALRDGNSTTIPKAHRPEGYDAPGFRVEARPPRQG